MIEEYIFGEDLGCGAVDADPLAERRGGGAVGADGRVETVHVDEAVDGEVLFQRLVARGGGVVHGEVAVGLHVGVHPVGDHGVVPRVLDHARLVRLVVHQSIPYLHHRRRRRHD